MFFTGTLAAALRLYEALVCDGGSLQTEILRQVLQTTIVRFAGKLRLFRIGILVIDGVLIPHQLLAVLVDIGSREMSLLTRTVIQFESTVQLQVFVRITPAAVAIGVPQQSVVLVREHKGNADLGVILEQVFVLALHIEFLRLVLAQSIESLIVRTVEQYAPRQAVTLGFGHLGHVNADLTVRNTEGLEGLSTLLGLLEQFLTIGIEERDTPRSLVDTSLNAGSFHTHHIVVFRDSELRFGGLWDDDETLLCRQLSL